MLKIDCRKNDVNKFRVKLIYRLTFAKTLTGYEITRKNQGTSKSAWL